MILSRGVTAVLFAVSFVYHCSAAPATLSMNLNHLGFRQSNFTLGDDPTFAIRIHPREGAPIYAPSMLMTAVDALTYIGLMDHRSRSSPELLRFHTLHLSIDVSPKPPATTVLNELGTDCIYFGIIDMIAENQYFEADFECFWNNVHAADVSMRKRDPAAVSPTANDTDSIDALTERQEPGFGYINNAKEINVAVAFVTCMSGIRAFSSRGRGIMTGNLQIDPGPQWDASIIFPDGPEHRPIRRQPPYMEFRYALLSMRSALNFMLAYQRFAEIELVYIVDGVRLGDAVMIKGKPYQNAVDANVATA